MKTGVLLAILFVSISIQAAVRVGPEALVDLPKEAEYSGGVNVRPGDGDVVDLNPPIFSWFQVTNILMVTYETVDYWEYQFQVATDPAFTNLKVDKRTPSNMYNLLAPFTNPDGSIYTNPLYWRVGYIATNGLLKLWSKTNTFTISPSATNWDRSMLADKAYLAQKYVHPHILINDGNRAAMYEFVKTNTFNDWNGLLGRYNSAINAPWWTDSTPWDTNKANPNMGGYALGLGSAMTYWALSQDPAVTNRLTQNFERLVDWYIASHYEYTDYGGGGDQPWILHCLVLGYDWMYPILNAEQKAKAVFAIQRTARFYNRNAFWSTIRNSGHWEFDDTGLYEEPRLMTWYNSSRTGTSHQWIDSSTVALIAAAAYGEGGDAREFYDLWINYMIARTHFTGGFAAINQGRGYTSIGLGGGGIIWNTIAFMSAFPEAQLHRIPMLNGFADWFSRITPPGYRGMHGMLSDGGDGITPDFTAYWNNINLRNLAMLTRDGNAWMAHLNEKVFGASSTESYFYHFPSTYYVWPPPTPTLNTSAKAFLEDGWLIASSKPANAIDAFTNGLGFILVARPRGTEGGHSLNCDGAVEMWAYGAKVTDGGGWNLDPYGYRPEAQDTLFINGQGVKVNESYGLYSSEGIVPWYARIAAYTNSDDFTYGLADITPAFTNRYNPQAPNALHARRHVLFSRTGKYFAMYDELATCTNSFFDWQWHILEPGVNNISSTGFRYGTTNRAGQTIINHVFFATSGLEFTNMTGTNVLRNPRTEQWFSDSGDPNRRSNSLWYRNASPKTGFTFFSVIVPQEPGKSPPSFTRIDDDTVTVIYDGVTETVAFGTNYTGSYTYRLELARVGTSTNEVSLKFVAGAPVRQAASGPVKSPPPKNVIRIEPNVAAILEAAPFAPQMNGVASVQLGSLRNDFGSYCGFRFVPRIDIVVTELGRWVASGNNKVHRLVLWDSTCNPLGVTDVDLANATANTFVYAPLPNALLLKAGSEYSVMSLETSGGDQFHNDNTAIVVSSDIGNVISAFVSGECGINTPGKSFGPVTFRYTKFSTVSQ